MVTRRGKDVGEIRLRKLRREVRKNFRRLIQPKISDEFTGLLGMFQPGRLPGDGGNEVGRAPQIFGDGFDGLLGGFTIRRADGDDQFARIREMLLVNFEALHGGNLRREQVEHLDIQMQPRKTRDDWNEQQPPPSRPFHGKNSPSSVSPVCEFCSRHELVSLRVNCQLPPTLAARSAGGNWNHPKRLGGAPRPCHEY